MQQMTTDLQQQIIDLVVAETSVKRDRVHVSSRLGEDIGMYGDDAVVFFEKFGDAFNVELRVLYEHWDCHFYPEGGGPPVSWFVVVFVGIVAGELLHQKIPWIPFWLSCVGMTLAFTWPYFKLVNYLGPPPVVKRPITVQTLVDAATSREWPLDYEVEDLLFRSFRY